MSARREPPTGPTPRQAAIQRRAAEDAAQLAQVQADRLRDIVAEAMALEARVTEAAAVATAEAQTKPLAELQVIGPDGLGKLIGRSTSMVKVDASRRPDTLPPRFVVPGMRKLLWRVVDVREWMDSLAEVEQERRKAQLRYSRTAGRGVQPTGEAATTRMYSKRAKGVSK